ncbi:hypothetical protein B0H13DRAFT_2097232 [Mycena leptocephala]|nr:hypothetical protein B0H13DRAFT_2097232 [Mycena leptocephala]
MLLLFIFIHVLSRNSTAVPVAHTLNVRTTDSCDDINHCRQLSDIVWGCLATIFACTWVSVHPNVPPPDQSWLALFGQRLKMMLIAVIAPEIMVGFAARQYFAARKLSKEFGFSMTHGFFFCMGGFVSSSGYPVVTKKQLKDPTLGFEFITAIRNINADDIMDKSKGDALSKGLALVQGLWFTAQCIARVHQHLVITQLEVATLAFAVVNVFIWLLWWDKPIDVQRQIIIGPPKPPNARPITAVSIERWDRFFSAILGITRDWDHKFNPLTSTSVPSFWSLPMTELDGIQGFAGPVGMTALVGTVFGAIHCAAWNVHFPTPGEMWMWRSCSSFITAIPVVISLVILSQRLTTLTEKTSILTELGAIVLWTEIPIYIASRMVLIILPLIAMRSLTSGAFVDVNWSVYVLHL